MLPKPHWRRQPQEDAPEDATAGAATPASPEAPAIEVVPAPEPIQFDQVFGSAEAGSSSSPPSAATPLLPAPPAPAPAPSPSAAPSTAPSTRPPPPYRGEEGATSPPAAMGGAPPAGSLPSSSGGHDQKWEWFERHKDEISAFSLEHARTNGIALGAAPVNLRPESTQAIRRYALQIATERAASATRAAMTTAPTSVVAPVPSATSPTAEPATLPTAATPDGL